MKYSDTLKGLRQLEKEGSCNDSLAEFLLDNECYYLLSKSEKYISQLQLLLATNSIILNQRYNTCKDILTAFEAIPYAHIKGAALASRIYGNPAYRFSGDIDILISPKHAEFVKTILQDNGYTQGRLINEKIEPYTRQEIIFQHSFSHQLAPFMKETSSKLCPFINIDINLNILWGESDLIINMDEFILHTEDFEIFGIKTKRLQSLWEFVALCMHHYKDMNSIYFLSTGGLQLSKYCDIYFYLINASPDADQLASIARQYKIDEYIYYCIYFANKIFADKRLSVYLETLYSTKAQQILNCYGLNEDERREWKIPFFDRLLDNCLSERFCSALSNEEYKKVQINRELM